METLGKVVDATLVIELYVWYIIAGLLIAAWAVFYLAFAALNFKTLFPRIFGVVLALCVVWLGVVSAYDYSYGFTEAVKFQELIVPATLLVAQFVICIILVVFRKRKH